MVSLKERLGVFVNDSQKASHVASLLAEKFGGATTLLGFGYWVSDSGETQIENVYYVFSFCNYVKREDLRAIVEKVAQWLEDQEAIAFELRGKLFLVRPKEALRLVEEA